MRTDELDYDLPASAIAQVPVEPRDAARLLVDGGAGVAPAHRHVRDLPDLLREGDLLVVNDTRVLPARVPVVRPTGGGGEVLLLEERDDGWWEVLCRPARKLRAGDVVEAEAGGLSFLVGEDVGDGRKLVRPRCDGPLLAALEVAGEMPLPPYITEVLDDAERYQTVFSERPASAAAPTAGLHLTPEVLERLERRGVRAAHVELVVGLDTFRPLSTDVVEDHVIHTERYSVPGATWEAVEATRAAGGRVVAVGTTSVRALESRAARGEPEGRTDLFITPGFEFAAVDLLLTNFHMPRTSLLALVQAFVGPRWRDLYATALDEGYRFLSFGDAMLLARSAPDDQGAAPAATDDPGEHP
ncbi:tRNA preQ1(34) S-adenosylmethionine ribosyltransferase-isomerase QueA [Dermatobacter hominis]|uniref:tRNA preQ1(34) S-adenosylmethionine ribosyltransferase-isomerase QueA n=1 Tax=Dermatobacter hominis TaxID=2884263 RepID=UPI001D11CEBB|nr:tRNA preQ1(34) S-adenosylmethionine ribosyltransferase-isomerase QueA [Dermatobacter hominis]UDY36162.1 tRNA preQ1(34) S-adenosylmethionine ribosyltransferase-isomerase QueA [Dermatobacter hominis]